MTIHHATVKKAATQGIVLSGGNDENVTAHHTETNRRIEVDPQDFESDTAAAQAAHAMLREVQDFEHENPDWRIDQVTEDDGGFEASRSGEVQIALSASDDDIDGLEACLAEMFDRIRTFGQEPGEDEGDEEPEVVHSVVPDRFKKLYAEIGVNKQDCGDWMAVQMYELCTTTDGKRDRVNVDAVEKLGWANGIDKPAIEGNRGWQGRYRMTIRNMLAKRVADAGTMKVPGEADRVPPADWIEKNKTKVKLSKKAKREAEEAAKQLAATPEAEPKAKKGRKGKKG